MAYSRVFLCTAFCCVVLGCSKNWPDERLGLYEAISTFENSRSIITEIPEKFDGFERGGLHIREDYVSPSAFQTLPVEFESASDILNNLKKHVPTARQINVTDNGYKDVEHRTRSIRILLYRYDEPYGLVGVEHRQGPIPENQMFEDEGYVLSLDRCDDRAFRHLNMFPQMPYVRVECRIEGNWFAFESRGSPYR